LFSDTGKFRTIEQGYQLFEGTDNPYKLIFLTIYDENQDISEEFEEIATRLAEKYPDHFMHHVYDCSNDPAMCPEELQKSLPMITAVIPAGYNSVAKTHEVKNTIYGGSMEFNSFAKWFLNIQPFFGFEVETKHDLDSEPWNYVFLAGEKKNQPSFFKALSTIFKDSFKFYYTANAELIKELGIDIVPKLQAYINGK
jgi:hypothetical protein